MTRFSVLVLLIAARCGAQEAPSGFELRTTITAGAIYSEQLAAQPRRGASEAGTFRAVLYPTIKLSEHWAISGAVQVRTRPYFYEELTTQGNGIRADVLQAHLSYSRYWGNKSLTVRAGELSSAFGSFLLRYDDFANGLISVPHTYGYYYKSITTMSLAGAQVDATSGKLDVRVQFTNSSPANRRSIFDREQYGNWTGGAGITIRQGFRVGVSGYRGPYLHRRYQFYVKGEADPRELPGTGRGIDVQWGHGGWNATGEWQRFQMDYRATAVTYNRYSYGELRRVLHPRWFVATRLGWFRSNKAPNRDIYEFAVGFRPNSRQLIKAGYQIVQGTRLVGMAGNMFSVQLVTGLPPLTLARQ